jgi:uncharacterized protein
MQLAMLIAALFLAVVSPTDKTSRVHDFAHLLSAEQRASLEQLSLSVERQTTAELVVVTVPSLDGEMVEEYAHELFGEWGIGKAKTKNGVLLLVAPNERRMKIEVGYGIEPLLTDSLCGEIADEFIVPRFKENNYAAGIVAGAEQLAAVMRANPDAARGDPNSGPILARAKRTNAIMANVGTVVAAVCMFALGILVASRRLYSTTAFFLATAVSATILGVAAFLTLQAPGPQQPIGWLGGASVASVMAWFLNLVRYRRYGPHGCSKCGTQLELLSEQDDDPKLTSVQLLEEQIGSVDYDVWICPACLNQDTERYVKNFSGFADCPACNARTFKEDPPVTIQAATTISAGSAQIDGRCVSCNHKSVRMIVLPRIQQSTSSSGASSSGGSFGGFSGGGGGGGFGGGSSGGGGASRGW